MRNNHENPSLGGRLVRSFRSILHTLRILRPRTAQAEPVERRVAQLVSRYVAEAPRGAEKSEVARDRR